MVDNKLWHTSSIISIRIPTRHAHSETVINFILLDRYFILRSAYETIEIIGDKLTRK